jgi:pyridoxamine 5'-phosphate oxidase
VSGRGTGPGPGRDHPLVEGEAGGDPFALFASWFEQAAAVVAMPEAMAVASVDGSGRPSSRMVLCKSWDRRGFVFFTNYESRKATELDARPVAALLFYWEALGRQVRIEGTVERVGEAESDAYFATRPRRAQIGAHASAQGRPVFDRAALDAAVAAATAEFEGGLVPRPAHWGGYRVHAGSFEFWQNRADRLHDRLRFLPDGDSWRVERLQP